MKISDLLYGAVQKDLGSAIMATRRHVTLTDGLGVGGPCGGQCIRHSKNPSSRACRSGPDPDR